MDREFDAIIIGAGPAGASTAILLARAGWRVAVVEKAVYPHRNVSGECIAAGNFPLLAALGVGDAVGHFAGPPLRRVAVMHGERTISAELPRFAAGGAPWGRALGREHLDALLLDQARRAGATVLQPWAARTVRSEPGHVSCGIAEVHSAVRATLTAPVLVAAHGSWETAPGAYDWAPEVQQGSDLFAFKASFRHVGLDAGLLPVMCFGDGYGGMVPAGDATATVAFCMRRDRLAACRKALPDRRAAEAALAYVTHACAGMRRMLQGAEQQGPWLSAGPIRPGIRIARQGSRCFLVGNAAGEAHPIIGEGMSMAIQSAWMLAQRLIRHGRQSAREESLTLLQRDYARAWRRSFAPRIRLASLFAHLAMHPRLAGCAAPVIERFPQLLTHAARWSGKVNAVTLQPTALPLTAAG